MMSETESQLGEAREPERHAIASDCMMADAQREEADALADATYASDVVGDINLLSIRVLEQGAQIAQLRVERDEREREIDRLRLSLAAFDKELGFAQGVIRAVSELIDTADGAHLGVL
jgi:hypothetical protein